MLHGTYEKRQGGAGFLQRRFQNSATAVCLNEKSWMLHFFCNNLRFSGNRLSQRMREQSGVRCLEKKKQGVLHRRTRVFGQRNPPLKHRFRPSAAHPAFNPKRLLSTMEFTHIHGTWQFTFLSKTFCVALVAFI